MPKISIITCVSRPEIYDRCLLASINKQRRGHDIEIIPILNEHNRYSASNALNTGIDVARSDLLVFAHQDVCLLHDWFGKLLDTVETLPDDWAILGAAGISLDYTRADIGRWGGALHTDTVAVGSVWDSDEKLDRPPYWDGKKEASRTHCADECLIVLNRKVAARFDPLFTGFHFYGVDLCLQARAAAWGVYCAHLPIIHYGSYSASFTGDSKYWLYLRLLYNKWHLQFPELLGTHMHWATFDGIQELTSYINVSIDSGDGTDIHLRSMGINKARFSSDRGRGLVAEVHD